MHRGPVRIACFRSSRTGNVLNLAERVRAHDVIAALPADLRYRIAKGAENLVVPRVAATV